MRSIITALAITAGLATPAASALAQPADPAARVGVTDAWARATVGTGTGAVYLTLTDHGAADQLTGASTPVAGTAQLHQDVMDGTVMRMRPVAALPLPPGQPVTLAPGGYHMMLEHLDHPLRRGDTFPLTLRFQHAAPVTVQVHVEGPGTTHPGIPSAAMPDMTMPGTMPGAAGTTGR